MSCTMKKSRCAEKETPCPACHGPSEFEHHTTTDLVVLTSSLSEPPGGFLRLNPLFFFSGIRQDLSLDIKSP